VALRGVRLPPTARELSLPLSVEGDAIVLDASIRTRDGVFESVSFGSTGSGGRTVLHAPIPPSARGGLLVGLGLAIDLQSQHSSAVLDGTLRLEPLQAGGETLVDSYAGWLASDGVRSPTAGVLRYIVSDQTDARFRISQPREAEPVPVIATPRLAAAAGAEGLLPLRLARGEVRTRVVGVARRFPTLAGEFVVAASDLLSIALDPVEPGAATPNELWLDVESDRVAEVEAALRRRPFQVLETRTRAELKAQLAGDPLARGALIALLAAAIAGAVVALLGLATTVASDLRDDRGELYDLEAQGAAPVELRRHVRARALVVTAAGLGAGLVLAAVLAALVTRVVTLSAGATEPQPPLRLAADWTLLALALGAYVVAAAAVVFGTTSATFREALPRRAEEAL